MQRSGGVGDLSRNPKPPQVLPHWPHVVARIGFRVYIPPWEVEGSSRKNRVRGHSCKGERLEGSSRGEWPRRSRFWGQRGWAQTCLRPRKSRSLGAEEKHSPSAELCEETEIGYAGLQERGLGHTIIAVGGKSRAIAPNWIEKFNYPHFIFYQWFRKQRQQQN